jgi:hypothetical protein
MATIRARRQSDGTMRYTAIVRIRKRKTIIYQEYKTFAFTSDTEASSGCVFPGPRKKESRCEQTHHAGPNG